MTRKEAEAMSQQVVKQLQSAIGPGLVGLRKLRPRLDALGERCDICPHCIAVVLHNSYLKVGTPIAEVVTLIGELERLSVAEMHLWMQSHEPGKAPEG